MTRNVVWLRAPEEEPAEEEPAGAVPPRRPSVGPRLVVASSVLVLGLAGGLAWVSRPQPAVTTAPVGLGDRLDPVDVTRAADVLSGEVQANQRQLTAAFFAGDEEKMVTLVQLQAEAAQLDLVNVRFVPRFRENMIEPVEADLEIRGGSYDVPIFVDSLYRQSRLMVVERITLTTDTYLAAQVDGTVECVFWRPARVPPGLFTEAMRDPTMAPARRAFTVAALSDAFRLEAMEVFQARLPALQKARNDNHEKVLRTLPSLVRQLAGSPMGWASADFTTDQPRVVTEPER